MFAAGFSENFALSLTSVTGFFRTGGWFMIPLAVCWFISLTIIFWKCLELRRRGVLPPDLLTDMENAENILSTGRFQAFLGRLRADNSVLAKISRTALSGRHPDKASATRAAETVAREEISKLERGVPVLEIIFTIAPMLGLIGTVSGLVRIFSSFGGAGAADSEKAQEIALGIAEAMNTTIAGLVVAVPALIAQVLFSRHIERIALRMGTLVNDLVDTCWRHFHGGPSAPSPEA